MTLSDQHVREVRALYEERVLAVRRAGKSVPYGTVRDIAELYGISMRWVYLIGMRLARETVPDEPAEPDAPAQPARTTKATRAKRRERAKRPPKSRRYPTHRTPDGRFASDPS